MKLLILGENSLLKLSAFDKSVFSAFPYLSSIYAYQLAEITPKKHFIKIPRSYEDIKYDEKYDAVLIHFKTGTSQRAYQIADKFKKMGTTVILSGSHPSALPDEAKQHSDSVIVGSAEYFWPVVLDDLEKNKLKNLYESKEKIDQKLFDFTNIGKSKGSRLLGAIEATRGCPYKCDFCQESNISQGSIFRTRPIEEVINEIKTLPQKFLLFCDVSMTIDPSYTKDLFRQMKNLNKKFVCEGNVDILTSDEELIRLSQEAGCIEWTVGFESFTQQTLDEVHKKTNRVEDFYHVVNNIHKYKMSVLGNLIFGFDSDVPDVFDFARENIAKLGLDSARFAILTPYPGTPLFNRLDEKGRILTKDWSKYNRKNVVFKPKNMSKEELESGFKKISNEYSSISNVMFRDFRSLRLGLYPFLATIGRNFESYMNRPR
jgi:radical SAM superfamily enzyme YgiQ (UPF0313 family)